MRIHMQCLAVFVALFSASALQAAAMETTDPFHLPCAFYVNSFGLANANNETFWLESEVYVNEAVHQLGRVEVGASVNYSGGEKQGSWTTTFLAAPSDQGFILVMPFNDSESESAPSYRRIDSFNLYVQVSDDHGHSIRTWMADPMHPYVPEDIFWGYPFYLRNRGTTANVTFTKYPSPIMTLKNQCLSSSR